MAKPTEKSIYRFDNFRLDGDKLMLYRGDEPVQLPPKAVETLLTLIRHRGEIISKDDLMEAVWKGAVVEESNLTQYLYLLRKRLGTRSDGSPYIETLRKRGYRFDSDSFEIDAGIHNDFDPKPHAPYVATEESAQLQADVAPAGSSPRRQKPMAARYSYLLAVAAVLLVIAISATLWQSFRKTETPIRAEQLNVVRLTNGIEINDAVISPDGKYFAYNEIDGHRSQIWVQQTGQSNRLKIVPWVDRWHGAKTFTPDGQFIYFLEKEGDGSWTTYRVPTLGGTAVKVLSGIDSPVSFSPSGQEFAFSRYDRANSTAEIVIRSTDGTAPERTILSWKGSVSAAYVAWSPDGKSIAFTSHAYFDPIGSPTIGRIDLATGAVEKLSNELWENCYRIEWRADGAGIYVIATKDGDGYTTRRDQLYYLSINDGVSRRVTLDGSRLQLASLSVTKDGSVLVVPFNRSSQIWSMNSNGDSRTAVQMTTGLADGRAGIAPLPDGRVAYIARAAENLNVWTMKENGADQKQLTTEPQFMEEIRASRDGRFLFVAVPDGRQNNLFRMNADGSGLTQITSGMHVIDSGPSHDGKWLAYDGRPLTGPTEEITLWKLPVDGGEPIKLETEGCARPHFSPDDRFISCVKFDERLSILSAADGKLVRSFDALPRATLHFGARWTPDGKALAYIVTEKDVSNIWIQPVDGSAPRRLTDFNVGSIYHFAFSFDGKRLYLARGTQIRDALLITTSLN